MRAILVSTEIPVTGEEREVVNEPFLFHDQLYNATCTSVGNPHCVIMMENVSKEHLVKDLGPYGKMLPFPIV